MKYLQRLSPGMAAHTQEFAHSIKGRRARFHHEFTSELGNERLPICWLGGCRGGFGGTGALSCRLHARELKVLSSIRKIAIRRKEVGCASLTTSGMS